MLITYDKKFLKWYGNLDKNKIRKEAIKQGLFSTVWNLIMFFIIDLTLISNNEIDRFRISLYILGGLFSFIIHYLFWIWNIKSQKKLYDESVAYWEEHDPEYLN